MSTYTPVFHIWCNHREEEMYLHKDSEHLTHDDQDRRIFHTLDDAQKAIDEATTDAGKDYYLGSNDLLELDSCYIREI